MNARSRNVPGILFFLGGEGDYAGRKPATSPAVGKPTPNMVVYAGRKPGHISAGGEPTMSFPRAINLG